MKAVVLDEYGGPEKLIYRESPLPDYGDNEVLVKVNKGDQRESRRLQAA